ncbi:hypothetical protein MVEN_00638000 [Mycena venus]|uniref:Uncharacterized protein n=1 Tax=Mycena venus TaxID=2733690 RepID=A0A8H6YQC4_9AGAR|nr:hypothetical protein MVEN_00638000 [Mycena venus]
MVSDSKFTKDQVAHIEGYLDELKEAIVSDTEKTWKDETAQKILKSELFLDQLPSKAKDDARGGTPDDWEKCLQAKFRNMKAKIQRRQRAAELAGSSGGSSSRVLANVGGGDVQSSGGSHSFFGRPKLTGLKLFELKHKQAILDNAKVLAAEASTTKTFPFYQPSKKALWDRLPEPQQVEFVKNATLMQNDVGINQAALETSLHYDADDFVKSGFCSDITMVVMFSFRKPDGNLVTSSTAVHSSPGGPKFNETPAFKDMFEHFNVFAEKALPPRAAKTTDYNIPEDEDGTPLFPEINLNTTSPAVVGLAIKQYVAKLWGHCRPSEPFSTENAAAHYDKNLFALPVAMEKIDSLTPTEILSMAEYFKGLEGDARFIFTRSGDEAEKGGGGENALDEGRRRRGERAEEAEKQEGKEEHEGEGEDRPTRKMTRGERSDGSVEDGEPVGDHGNGGDEPPKDDGPSSKAPRKNKPGKRAGGKSKKTQPVLKKRARQADREESEAPPAKKSKKADPPVQPVLPEGIAAGRLRHAVKAPKPHDASVAVPKNNTKRKPGWDWVVE